MELIALKNRICEGFTGSTDELNLTLGAIDKEKEIKDLKAKLDNIEKIAKDYLAVGVVPMKHIINAIS